MPRKKKDDGECKIFNAHAANNCSIRYSTYCDDGRWYLMMTIVPDDGGCSTQVILSSEQADCMARTAWRFCSEIAEHGKPIKG